MSKFKIAYSLVLCILGSHKAAALNLNWGTRLEKELSFEKTALNQEIPITAVDNVNSKFLLGDRSLDRSILNLLQTKGLNSSIGIQSHKNTLKSKSFQKGVSLNDYSYTFNGYPICHSSVRIVQQENGEQVIVGAFPKVDDRYKDFDVAIWPTIDNSVKILQNFLTTDTNAILEIDSFEKCLVNHQGQLSPALNLIFKFNGTFYTSIVSDNKLEFIAKNQFDVTAGTAEVYLPNVEFGSLQNVNIPVAGDGTLVNSFFKTRDYNSTSLMVEPSNNFQFTGKSSESAQIHAFTYANLQLKYFESLGYNWDGGQPVHILVHARDRGNAGYLLPTRSKPPFIVIGEGDGKMFKDLEYDSDVVAHELGHHIVVSSIYNLDKFEAVVLHEGLADFFTLSARQDSCLAPSVCVDNSTAESCQMFANKCLRSAENEIRYKDEHYNSESFQSDPHMSSMVISGFLWDLSTSNYIPRDTVVKYAYSALSYVPSNSNIKNFIAALYYVDSLNGSKYSSTIEDIAASRGLGLETLGIDLADLPPSLGKSPSEQIKPNQLSYHLKESVAPGCASIKSQKASHKTNFLVFALCLMPIILLKDLVSGRKNKLR